MQKPAFSPPADLSIFGQANRSIYDTFRRSKHRLFEIQDPPKRNLAISNSHKSRKVKAANSNKVTNVARNDYFPQDVISQEFLPSGIKKPSGSEYSSAKKGSLFYKFKKTQQAI